MSSAPSSNSVDILTSLILAAGITTLISGLLSLYQHTESLAYFVIAAPLLVWGVLRSKAERGKVQADDGHEQGNSDQHSSKLRNDNNSSNMTIIYGGILSMISGLIGVVTNTSSAPYFVVGITLLLVARIRYERNS